MRFTQNKVDNFKPPPEKAEHQEWDDAMTGFGIRFRKGGRGAYFFQYSLHGLQRKVSLGKVDQVRLADAQKEAAQIAAKVARGEDPAAARAEKALKGASTFGSHIEDFLDFLRRNDRSDKHLYGVTRSLNTHFAAVHALAVTDVSRALVAVKLKEVLKNSGARSMGLARAHVRKYYNWMIGEGLCDDNPVKGTNEEGDSERRDRVLSPDELVAIWNASGDDDYGTIIKLLILLPLRLEGIGQLNRKTELFLAEGNDPLKTRLLDLPARVNKNGERFLMPLSRRAEAILRSVEPRKGSDFMFGSGARGFTSWSYCKAKLDAKLGPDFEPWIHHDFRRSFETLGKDKCRIPWATTDVCLHHVGEHKKGVKRSYNYSDYLDEKRDAMERWAGYIDGLLDKRPSLKAVI